MNVASHHFIRYTPKYELQISFTLRNLFTIPCCVLLYRVVFYNSHYYDAQFTWYCSDAIDIWPYFIMDLPTRLVIINYYLHKTLLASLYICQHCLVMCRYVFHENDTHVEFMTAATAHNGNPVNVCSHHTEPLCSLCNNTYHKLPILIGCQLHILSYSVWVSLANWIMRCMKDSIFWVSLKLVLKRSYVYTVMAVVWPLPFLDGLFEWLQQIGCQIPICSSKRLWDCRAYILPDSIHTYIIKAIPPTKSVCIEGLSISEFIV